MEGGGLIVGGFISCGGCYWTNNRSIAKVGNVVVGGAFFKACPLQVREDLRDCR